MLAIKIWLLRSPLSALSKIYPFAERKAAASDESKGSKQIEYSVLPKGVAGTRRAGAQSLPTYCTRAYAEYVAGRPAG